MEQYQWVEQLKARGMLPALDLALNVLEPLGPLAAQFLYIIQPISGAFGLNHAVSDIAQALEEPGGIETLRAKFEIKD